MIGQILPSLTGLATSWLESKETTVQLFDRHEFAMPTAALQGHVIVANVVELGHREMVA
jgi:hypothetical protein